MTFNTSVFRSNSFTNFALLEGYELTLKKVWVILYNSNYGSK